ncbi:MAG: SDR family oxidoreductase [Bacilli bacterium]|nr:SDR family oxidoreductase [Bacilli bacterium]
MLEGKVALITGSSRGIGFDIAKLFLKEKARVVVCGSSVESAEKAKNELLEFGFSVDDILPLPFDMNKREEFDGLVKSVIDKWGNIDILVNNAGITSNVQFLDSTDEDYIKMYDINFFGVVSLTRIVARYMKENGGGSIINTSSMVGINGGRGQADYASSKSAINGLTISLAKELGPYNIRVNAVAPGVVGTDMMRDSVNDDMKKMLISMTPLRKMGEPRDIAGAYLYLASDLANFTTGTIIKVDGGLMM